MCGARDLAVESRRGQVLLQFAVFSIFFLQQNLCLIRDWLWDEPVAVKKLILLGNRNSEPSQWKEVSAVPTNVGYLENLVEELADALTAGVTSSSAELQSLSRGTPFCMHAQVVSFEEHELVRGLFFFVLKCRVFGV